MFCEKCNQNQATISLTFQYNQERQKMDLCTKCYQTLRSKMKNPSGVNPFSNSMNQEFSSPPTEEKHGEGVLDQYGQNLSNAANTGLIDPVIGRKKEVDQVIEILNRRNKNNPVLIGEPGVGKTAIAEGLALKISEGNVPTKLTNKVVYLLDVASLVSNTGIRGQFEERMKQLISELQERQNVILFIDEVHQLVGAGAAEGSMDAGNILKPALARGELQLIGATTLKEYRDIEKDAALERRFQPVMVHEPSLEQAIEILKGIQTKYEDYHKVSYSEDAIEACVNLSNRYIQDRYLPDKAIDLLDQAGSKLNLRAGTTDPSDIENRLHEINKQKEIATNEENYELAAKLRDEEKQLEEKLNQASEPNHTASVTKQDIQKIIEEKTGIPVSKLQENEQTKMKDLDKQLNASVIGQEEAVKKITKAIRRSRAGLKNKNRPIGSFLFVGPTGVGKTELTKSLAKELFGDKSAMIRLDMSEYMEKHSVSKLIGSPPGYVGHDEAGQLTEQVRRKPYSIILLDEIEKAHPDVQHMFLQILEDGRLTDSQGRNVSFKDTVIIMTSNAGVTEKKVTVGFGNNEFEQETRLLDSLGNYFKPEFLNRFDNIIEFNTLEKAHLLEIVDLMLDEVSENLEEQGLSLSINVDAKEKLAELGYHPAFGARPLRRAIQEYVEDAIADLLIDENEIESIHVEVKENNIVAVKA